MTAAARKTRVAVLGGGAGAMAAALELLRTPERRAALDVTVYQLGWRLGGKGASGRNAAHGQRIEEHGLHLWFGFYDNAFRTLGAAYEAAGRPPTSPLSSLWDAFRPCHQIVVYDQWDGRWASQRFDVPVDGARPGGAGAVVAPAEVIHLAVAFLHRSWRQLAGDVLGVSTAVAEAAFAEALAHAERRRGHHAVLHHELDVLLADALRVARSVVWHHVRHRLDQDHARHLFQLVDLVTSAWCGIVAERVLERGFGVIDDRDLRAWLRQHGASDVTIGTGGNTGSGLVRGFYDLVFAYDEGDVARPDLAAGRALQAAIKMVFDFKGSVMWRMEAGMGDVVFAPFYEALVELGGPDCVRFFHRVTGLRLDPSGTAVAAVDLVRQADVVGGRYEPLVDVKGLPCWPSEPRWDQLVDGDRLAAAGVDFERPCPLPGDVPVTLEVGRDVDVVVLAIPTPAHPELCAELIAASPAYAEMVRSHRAVATEAFQVWSRAPESELGWPFPSEAVASAFVEPLDTVCPMPQLVEREDWPAGTVASIWYVCGVLPDVERFRCDADGHGADVRARAVGWLEGDAAVPWPAARHRGRFDWRVLADPDGHRVGPARFDSQYWRANTTPSELYVRTPPGSVTKRLWPGGSGFDHLALAGDWTRNYIDGGCVEAAVISGLLAARSVLERAGVADREVRIDGEGTWLLEGSG